MIGSNALFAFIQFLITRHDQKKNALSKFVQRGGITLKERRNLDYIYRPYRAAGGNGDCQIGYEACEKLPTLSEEEAAAMDRKIKRREYGIEDDVKTEE